MRIRLVIPGVPVPLERSRTARGSHYLPPRSREYRDRAQAAWMAAGRPSLGDVPLVLVARFYGARASADLSNLVKGVEDALNGLAYGDDRQIVCLSGVHKLPVGAGASRTEIELWPSEGSAR
jgi:crossover junction endodeoxyribonuclease RusA